jgi:hypothetical protein
MNVLHIIPSVLNYFKDIRATAMHLVENERDFGINSDAYTLQYGTVGRKEQDEVHKTAPAMRFVGLFSGSHVISELESADVVHIHAPFLGLAGDLIAWKKKTRKPLVISFYRGVPVNDVFSFLLFFYNRFYLARLLKLCDLAVVRSRDVYRRNAAFFPSVVAKKTLILNEEIDELKTHNIHLTLGGNKLKLTNEDVEAAAYISIYNQLTNIS